MTTIIVEDFTRLADDDLRSLVNAVRTGSYKILIENPGLLNTPKGLLPFLKKKKSYQYIFNDDTGKHKYMLLSFDTPGQRINIPIAVFGVSPANKVNFPIVIGQLCGTIIMIGKDQLSRILQVQGEDCDRYFSSLLEIRKTLIESLFQTYGSDEYFTSVMSWQTKSKASLTRIIAEQQDFIRRESSDGSTEFYFSSMMTDKELEYLEECNSRLTTLGKEKYGRVWNFYNKFVDFFLAKRRYEEKARIIRYYHFLFSLN